MSRAVRALGGGKKPLHAPRGVIEGGQFIGKGSITHAIIRALLGAAERPQGDARRNLGLTKTPGGSVIRHRLTGRMPSMDDEIRDPHNPRMVGRVLRVDPQAKTVRVKWGNGQEETRSVDSVSWPGGPNRSAPAPTHTTPTPGLGRTTTAGGSTIHHRMTPGGPQHRGVEDVHHTRSYDATPTPPRTMDTALGGKPKRQTAAERMRDRVSAGKVDADTATRLLKGESAASIVDSRTPGGYRDKELANMPDAQRHAVEGLDGDQAELYWMRRAAGMDHNKAIADLRPAPKPLPSGADIEAVDHPRDLTPTQISQGDNLTPAGRSAIEALGPAGHPRIAAIPDSEEKVREAFRMLAGGGGGVDHYVALSDVRRLIGDQVPRSEVDDTLRRMERMPDVQLSPQSYSRQNAAIRRPAALMIGGQEQELLHIEDPSRARPQHFPAVSMAEELDNRRAGRPGDPMMARLSDAELQAEIDRRAAADPFVARELAAMRAAPEPRKAAAKMAHAKAPTAPDIHRGDLVPTGEPIPDHVGDLPVVPKSRIQAGDFAVWQAPGESPVHGRVVDLGPRRKFVDWEGGRRERLGSAIGPNVTFHREGGPGAAARKMAAAKAPTLSTAEHAAALEKMGSREEAAAYLANVKGQGLTDLAKHYHVNSGSVAGKRDAIARASVGNRLEGEALRSLGSPMSRPTGSRTGANLVRSIAEDPFRTGSPAVARMARGQGPNPSRMRDRILALSRNDDRLAFLRGENLTQAQARALAKSLGVKSAGRSDTEHAIAAIVRHFDTSPTPHGGGAVAKMSRAKAPRVDLDELAGRLNRTGTEGDTIRVLAAEPLTTTGLRDLAERLNIAIPPSMRAKSSMQLHIAQELTGHRKRTLGFDPATGRIHGSSPTDQLMRQGLPTGFDPNVVAEQIHSLGNRDRTHENVLPLLQGYNLAQLRRIATANNIQLPKSPPDAGYPRWTADLLRDYIAMRVHQDRNRWSLR